MGAEFVSYYEEACPECCGAGAAWGSRCHYCDGAGLRPTPSGSVTIARLRKEREEREFEFQFASSHASTADSTPKEPIVILTN